MLSFVLVVLGCQQTPETTKSTTPGPDGPPDPPTDGHHTSSDSGVECWTNVIEADPADGDDDVYYRATVRAELDDPDLTATLRVLAQDGSEVPGIMGLELNDDSTRLTWEAVEPLIPNTTYTSEVTHVCGVEQFIWTTSEIGQVLTTEIMGNTYALDVANGVWVAPPGAGGIFTVLLRPYRVLLRVTGESETTLDLLAGVSINGHQNECAPTVEFLGAPWSDPYFDLYIESINLETDTFFLEIGDFALSAAFAPDAERIQGEIAGLLDTRDLGAALGVMNPEDPNAVCNMLDDFLVFCLPCADGEPYCLDIEVEDVEGPKIQAPLVPVAEEAIDTGCLP